VDDTSSSGGAVGRRVPVRSLLPDRLIRREWARARRGRRGLLGGRGSVVRRRLGLAGPSGGLSGARLAGRGAARPASDRRGSVFPVFFVGGHKHSDFRDGRDPSHVRVWGVLL
jgi:hypothetical protein